MEVYPDITLSQYSVVLCLVQIHYNCTALLVAIHTIATETVDLTPKSSCSEPIANTSMHLSVLVDALCCCPSV